MPSEVFDIMSYVLSKGCAVMQTLAHVATRRESNKRIGMQVVKECTIELYWALPVNWLTVPNIFMNNSLHVTMFGLVQMEMLDNLGNAEPTARNLCNDTLACRNCHPRTNKGA